MATRPWMAWNPPSSIIIEAEKAIQPTQPVCSGALSQVPSGLLLPERDARVSVMECSLEWRSARAGCPVAGHRRSPRPGARHSIRMNPPGDAEPGRSAHTARPHRLDDGPVGIPATHAAPVEAPPEREVEPARDRGRAQERQQRSAGAPGGDVPIAEWPHRGLAVAVDPDADGGAGLHAPGYGHRALVLEARRFGPHDCDPGHRGSGLVAVEGGG